MRLSLLSIMQNEAALVPRWVASIRRQRGVFDEIVVVDGGSRDGTVANLLAAGIVPIVRQFPDHFGEQRNFAIDQTAGEWIFELDADEMPSAPLLAGLHAITKNADANRVDCIGIPRLNFHDFTLQPGPGFRGLDFQYRLHRRHCRWRNVVHEEIAGYCARVELDICDGHFLYHLKSAARHVERNAQYRSLASP